MPYLVTAKRSGIELRDGSTASDPMHKLIKDEPVLFHNLPCGYRVPGDCQVGITEAIEPEHFKAAGVERCEDLEPLPEDPTPTYRKRGRPRKA
jgi:hypothetical protein